MLAILLVAGSLGLDNFAVSIAIGLSGVDRRLRARVALAFGLFEAGTPAVGLLLGRQLSHGLGGGAHIVGGLLLTAAGAHTTISALRADDATHAQPYAAAKIGRLLVLAAGLSIDNLIVGFALGAYHASLLLSIATIALVSVGLTLLGLELGNRLGERVEHSSELLGGIVLTAVGLAILTNVV